MATFRFPTEYWTDPDLQAELWRFLPGIMGWILCIGTIVYFNWPDPAVKRAAALLVRSQANKNIRVSGLYIYPIKSCRGLKVESTQICPTGFQHDRIFMLCELQTDDSGQESYKMLTIRNKPRMALIDTHIEDGTLIVSVAKEHLNGTSLAPARIPLDYAVAERGEQVEVKLHSTLVTGYDLGADLSAFFTTFLGCKVRLLRSVENTRTTKDFLPASSHVAFADRYPLLVTSDSSLADLNNKMRNVNEKEVEEVRMRPNIVLSGLTEKFEEEGWKRILVGQIKVYIIARCTRCSLPSVDLQTGLKNTNNQPKTIVTDEYGNCFGMHALIYGTDGSMSVGDEVKVVD